MMHVKEQTKWPAGGGEVGALIRAHAWEGTPLGALEGWPRNLKVVVDLMFSSGFPLVLVMGREHILLYNDAFSHMLSQLHPAALGRPLFEVLPEVRPTIEGISARVWAGETLSFQDQHFQVPRNGPVEDMWVDVSYGPIRDEAGAVAGILARVAETTAKVLAERRRDEVEAELREREARQRLLVELGDRTREPGAVTAFLRATVELLLASEARQAFLVELSDRLRDAEAPAEIMRSATELLGRWLGVAAVGYGEFEPDGDTVVNGTEYNDGRMPSAQGRRRLSDHGPGFAPAMRAGQEVFTEDLTRDPRAPEGGAPATHAMQIRGGGAVPLVKGGRLVAYLYAVHPEPRAWPEEDRRLVREVADRTWATLERARAETALRQTNRAKDEFLAILAHELRNPLAPVTNALELLTPGHADAHALEQARVMMARQVQQLVRLTDDLLDVSRISRGKVQLRRDRVPLADVVQQAVETSRPLVERGHNELTLELPNEPIFLDADPTRLAQVFSNLLNNAAKYSQPGGLISLRAERQDDGVVVRVRDMGIGIPSDMLQRVFDIFTQVDRSLEKAQGGLGVGLSLAKGLVELHGGSIEAHSDGHGRGSEFVVRLPIYTGVAQAAPRAVEDRPAASALRRVLVVDDNEDAATSLAMLLKVMNCDARVAHGGFEALEVAPEFRPELVLLDLGMPKLNGYDTCRRMRAEPWGRALKIVALTGWTKAENDQRAEEAGFDEHLVKPADRATISQLLRSLPRPEEAARHAPPKRPTA